MSTTYPPVTIPDTERRSLHSVGINQEYDILVALPPGYATTNQAYPVLYVLDPQVAFGTFTDAVRLLTAFGDIAPVMVVGIAHQSSDILQVQPLRVRDFTPTVVEGYYDTEMKPYIRNAAADAGSGGAAAFLRFIHEELIPFINADYRTLPDDSGLVGGSLGGLFALYALFQQPHVFRRYLVISPSIWWDDNVILRIEEAFASRNTDLDATVFMSVGGEEGKMPAATEAFASIIRSRRYPSLGLTSQVFEGEIHMSAGLPAIARGLRVLYSPASQQAA